MTWERGLLCALLLCCACVQTTFAAGFAPITTTLKTGLNPNSSSVSVAQVGGFPAIVYFDTTVSRLIYTVNEQPDGSGAWVPQTIPDVVSGVTAIDLIGLTNGKPAFAVTTSVGVEYFVLNVSTWVRTPISSVSSVSRPSIALVQNRPALVFAQTVSGTTTIIYVINSVSDGTGVFSSSTVVASSGSASTSVGAPRLSVIGGKPAVLHTNTSIATYSVNPQVDGLGVWPFIPPPPRASQAILTAPLSLIEFQGRPAGIFVLTTAAVLFQHSATADGTSTNDNWPGSQFDTTNFAGGGSNSLATMKLINGLPMAAYRRFSQAGVASDLVLAINRGGSAGPWEVITLTTPAGGTAPSDFSLASVNNRPALAVLTTGGAIQFIRSTPPVAIAQNVDVAKNTPKPITLTGTSAQGNTLGFRVLGTPANGGVTGTGANVTYTPTTNYSGLDAFQFIATDEYGDGASATVNLSVFNGPEKTWVVENVAPTGAGSLNLALNRARTGHTVRFDPAVFDLGNSDAATVINLDAQLPDLDDGNVTIDAVNRRVTVNGSGAGNSSGLRISSSGNTVRGLSITGFQRSGILLTGAAANNTIGGDRLTGFNPNGQGLRISDCGLFGLELNGAGVTNNSIKGCWIGLDPSGTAASANLAGVIIRSGATLNTLGGALPGEANVISGNTFEGITVSDNASDGNIVIGNTLGMAAVDDPASSREASDALPTRRAIGNGSAGVFISQGTRGSRVGGTSPGHSNAIANNGGSGIEVRVQNTRENTALANRITRNVRGGIALFDGSNGGITAPTFSAVARSATPSTTAGLVKAQVSGSSASPNGTVELFADAGEQGGRLLGRAVVAGGAWSADIDISDLDNITATLTDSVGNTSPFAVFGRVPPTNGGGGGSGGSPALDTDNDGVSDELETLAGTNPQAAGDAPLAQATAIGVDKLQIALNFAKPGSDSVKGTYRVALPAGFAAAGARVAVQVGGWNQNVTLDAKGKAPRGGAKITLRVGRDGSGALIQFSAKSDLQTLFTPLGLDNTTTATTGKSVTVPAALALASGGTNYVFLGEAVTLYKAKQGKIGKAAK